MKRLPSRVRPRRLVVLAAICLAGFLYCAYRAFMGDTKLRAFQSDAGCTAGLEATATPASACSVQSATIIGHLLGYQTREGRPRFVTLDLGQGRVDIVKLSTYPDAFWTLLTTQARTPATVQMFRNQVDVIRTAGGTAKTSSYPIAAPNLGLEYAAAWFALVGIVCGVVIVRANSRATK